LLKVMTASSSRKLNLVGQGTATTGRLTAATPGWALGEEQAALGDANEAHPRELDRRGGDAKAPLPLLLLIPAFELRGVGSVLLPLLSRRLDAGDMPNPRLRRNGVDNAAAAAAAALEALAARACSLATAHRVWSATCTCNRTSCSDNCVGQSDRSCKHASCIRAAGSNAAVADAIGAAAGCILCA